MLKQSGATGKVAVLIGNYFLTCDCGNEENADIRYPVDRFEFLDLEHLDGYWYDNYKCRACGESVSKYVGEFEEEETKEEEEEQD